MTRLKIEILKNIGKSVLEYHENDYHEANEYIFRMGIKDVLVFSDCIIIDTYNPGRVIGLKGKLIELIAKNLGTLVKIHESDNEIMYHMFQVNPNEYE